MLALTALAAGAAIGAVTGIADKVLSKRLSELEECGLVTRTQYSEIPPRVEYELTSAGLAFEPVIAAMDTWSREVAPGLPAVARGSGCG